MTRQCQIVLSLFVASVFIVFSVTVIVLLLLPTSGVFATGGKGMT